MEGNNMAKPRNPAIDAYFPAGAREKITRLFGKYNLNLVPHLNKTNNVMELRARGRGKGAIIEKHVTTLEKFLSMPEQDQEDFIKYIHKIIHGDPNERRYTNA
jgi:hypothetical protein